MSTLISGDHIVYDTNHKENAEILGKVQSRVKQDGEPPTTMEAEKRIRREIANSNERRRMQSINAGFQSLRSLLPHHEGEKLSKAAILQQTAEYIYSLEQEKTRLLSQNCQLKRLVNQHEVGELPPKKRKTEVILPTITDSNEECMEPLATPEPVGILSVAVVDPIESPPELRRQLDHERGLRVLLEEQIRQLEGQLYQQQVYQMSSTEDTEDIALQVVTADSLPPIGHTQTVVCSEPPSRTPSPEPTPEQRLPSVLEAAIKAEPKVEVERLPSPNPSNEESTSSRIYIPNTSRQNLETIVEAIRHLEGDHMFAEEPQNTQQEVPLALTTSRASDRLLKVEMNQFLEFHTPCIQLQQQSRPGVIVVKQAS
ncbi:hypothetical protein RI129_008058 [Pyrocoelia pectoralis]|uniref:BHLH domain-containing protein n=1 Tax=Pyrocoelia pectoralis TaxID=417401 RepID=A0AAN7ZM42_9COLE